MIVIQIPSQATVSAAFDWLERQGHAAPIRLVLYRGPDGGVRGSALVRRP